MNLYGSLLLSTDMKLIAAIYWYQKNTEIWHMIVDDAGNYIEKPHCVNVNHDLTLIKETVQNFFNSIKEYKDEGHDIEIKYKTLTTVAAEIRKSLAKPNPETLAVDREITGRLKKLHYLHSKKNEIEASQRKALIELLKPLLGEKPKARLMDLWAIAFHKDSFKNLVKKLWKLVKNATGEPMKKGDLKTKFEADYQLLVKAHPPKK